MRKHMLFLSCLVVLVSTSEFAVLQSARGEANPIIVTPDDHGINVTLNDKFELYFNASNGGEITRYYDLVADPSRSMNLVKPSFPYNQHLWPMFTSGFYNPYKGWRATTGMDAYSKITILEKNSNYVILHSLSRIGTPDGIFLKDVDGNFNYVISAWLIRSDGYIFLERTFYSKTYSYLQNGTRWYPFYLTRTKGFQDEGVFYFFNTTYAYTYSISEDTYQDKFSTFPTIPIDKNGFFGIAAPFSNMSIGGDGTNNIILVYKFDENSGIGEWRSDTFNGEWGSSFGPTYEFNVVGLMAPNTYRAMIFLTHEPIGEQQAPSYAKYFSQNNVFPLLQVTLSTNKYAYVPGNLFELYVRGVAYYNLMDLLVTLTVTDSKGNILLQKNYGRYNVTEGRTWDSLLWRSSIPSNAAYGYYTFTIRYLSVIKTTVASDSITILVLI